MAQKSCTRGNVIEILKKMLILDPTFDAANTTFADQYFSYGWLKFTSGSNAGLDLDVSLYEDNQIILAVPVLVFLFG